MPRWSAGAILLIIAIICFVLDALVDVRVNLIAVGLAFMAAAFLVDNVGLGRRP